MASEHCALHDVMFTQMAKNLQSMADSLTSALERIAIQSTANGEKLEAVLLAQGDRKAVCARQDMRIEACEKDDAHQWTAIEKTADDVDKMALAARAELDAKINKIWDAVNTLRRVVYIGIGLWMAFEAYVKIHGGL